jgi:hypothetical protein
MVFMLDSSDRALLEALAARLGVSRAEVVRRAIRRLAEEVKAAGGGGAGGQRGQGDDPGQDEVIGVSSPATVGEVMEAARRYLRDELSRALAASLINGIMEVRGALGRPEARRDVTRLRERVRELVRMYDLLARRTRARSVLGPLGEELVVIAGALKVPLHEGAPSGRGRR